MSQSLSLGVRVAFAIVAIAALSGCASTIRVPNSFDEAVEYFPCSPEHVRDECSPALIEFLTGSEISVSPDGEPTTIRAGSKVLRLLSAADGELVSCFVVGDAGDDGISASGCSEHWNLLVSDSENGTVVRAWRHFRRASLAVPVSDGSREAEFLRALRGRLDECASEEDW